MATPSNEDGRPQTEGAAGVIERNVHALLAHREQFERNRSAQDRLAGAIARFAGSMPFVYVHVLVFTLWIGANRGWFAVKPFDPSLVTLAVVATIEALFLAVFVLISQNRMAELADKRADLDLQVSLLVEHEVTRLVELVTEIAKKMNIDASHDPELSELAHRVDPGKVLDALEETERQHAATKH